MSASSRAISATTAAPTSRSWWRSSAANPWLFVAARFAC
jgi:hypothetical protein